MLIDIDFSLLTLHSCCETSYLVVKKHYLLKTILVLLEIVDSKLNM